MLTLHSVMIQVLLHFLILSLPAPSSPSSADKKRKRLRKSKDPRPNLQESLEVLTDRLCIWRETDFALSDSFTGPSTFSERDWLQTFCEGVVRPAFQHLLPPLYESFREKCFPESVGEDVSESESDPIVTAAPPGVPSGSADPSGSDELSLLPPRTFSRSNSISSTSNKTASQLLNSRREVTMRRSVSVQRDIGAGAGVKGKERERQSQGAIKAGMALSNKGTARTARSSSFSVPGQLPDLQQQKRSATTLVPETPMRGGRGPSRLLGRTMTLNDLGRSQSSRLQIGLHDNFSGLFAEKEDSDHLSGDMNSTMVFDEPEQVSVLDAAGPSRGRSRSGSGTVVLVQGTPVRPRSHSTGPLAPSGGNFSLR